MGTIGNTIAKGCYPLIHSPFSGASPMISLFLCLPHLLSPPSQIRSCSFSKAYCKSDHFLGSDFPLTLLTVYALLLATYSYLAFFTFLRVPAISIWSQRHCQLLDGCNSAWGLSWNPNKTFHCCLTFPLKMRKYLNFLFGDNFVYS